MTDKATILKALRKIPGVGQAVAMDLWNLGYRSVADLKGEDADIMYVRYNDYKGQVQDICMLYTFRSAIYFANTLGGPQDPFKLKWWNWMDKQKVDSKTKDAGIRSRMNGW
jgi:hypothetical protein